MSRNSASHLSSPTHALPPQSESEQGGGEHMASQPPSGGSGAGMSPLQVSREVLLVCVWGGLVFWGRMDATRVLMLHLLLALTEPSAVCAP